MDAVPPKRKSILLEGTPAASIDKDRWKTAVLTINAARRFRYSSFNPAISRKSSRSSSVDKSEGAALSRSSSNASTTRSDSVTDAPPARSGLAANRWKKSIRVVKAANRFNDLGAMATQQREAAQKPVVTLENGFGILGQDLNIMLELPHDASNLTKLEGFGGVMRVAACVKSDPEKGIPGTPEDLATRQDKFGENKYPEEPARSFFEFVWEASQDFTLHILCACAAAALGTGMYIEGPEEGWYDGAGIFFAIILVVMVTAVNDYRQDLQFRELDAKNKDLRVNVLRGGITVSISIYEIVVGDILVLATGDQVAADGLCVSAASLMIDESTMTGESDHLKKDPITAPFMLSGTKVADGYGAMLVTGVGQNTEWGRLMASGKDPEEAAAKLEKLEEQLAQNQISQAEYDDAKEELESEDKGAETPLQVRLNGLANRIGQLGLGVAVLVFIILMCRWLSNFLKEDRKFATEDLEKIVDYFAIAVTIVVVAVPEGLPLAVTLSLAYSMKKMMNDNALVRHLKACETMGGATTICSDKTGTLTTNEMTVVKSWIAGNQREAEDTQSDETKRTLSSPVMTLLLQAICKNSEGEVYTEQDGKPLNPPMFTGTPTEMAVLKYGHALGADFKAVKAELQDVARDPFNSTKKKMGVLCKVKDGYRVHWKGASEIVLRLCTKMLTSDGSIVEMTEEKRAELFVLIDSMASKSLRTLCLAYADYPTVKNAEEELPDHDLICIAILGIKDPCRPGVPQAVERCQMAGIVVRMVTGDNEKTAKAIARECGILTDGGLAVEGQEFRRMSNEQRVARFGPKLEKLQVMARSSPSDKYDLVHMLRGLGEVVGVTGDGTNDSRALKEADIGLAMGIAGTEVAKKSSDIVIMDDNFASIVTVVRWGRSVYSNIQKFVQFQLTVNLVALTLNFIAAVATGQAPLTAVQLLWVNLIMDTMGALALGTEPPKEELMKQKPYGRTSPLITNIMWRNIIGQTIFQLAVLLIYTFEGYSLFNLEEVTGECKLVLEDGEVAHSYSKELCVDAAGESQWHAFDDHEKHEQHDTLVLNTIIFNTFVFCQVFNEMNAREMEKKNVFDGFFKNHMFMGIIAITCVFQVLLVELLGTFASTTHLSWDQWLICVAIGFISVPLAVLVKFIPVPEEDFFRLWELAQLEMLPRLSMSSEGVAQLKEAQERAYAAEYELAQLKGLKPPAKDEFGLEADSNDKKSAEDEIAALKAQINELNAKLQAKSDVSPAEIKIEGAE